MPLRALRALRAHSTNWQACLQTANSKWPGPQADSSSIQSSNRGLIDAPTPPTLALLVAACKGAHMRLQALTLRRQKSQQAVQVRLYLV